MLEISGNVSQNTGKFREFYPKNWKTQAISNTGEIWEVGGNFVSQKNPWKCEIQC